MTFDISIDGSPYRAFADTGASRRFISKRVVDQQGLQIHPFDGRVDLEGGHGMRMLGSVRIKWNHGSFAETATFIVLDMEQHDIILGEDFWIQHQAVPDYSTLGLKVLHQGQIKTLKGVRLN